MPLEKKLGLKDASYVTFAGLPPPLGWLAPAAEFASDQRFKDRGGFAEKSCSSEELDVIHGFSISRADLEDGLVQARKVSRDGGMIRVSWPKRVSKMVTDITKDTFYEICLPMSLGDVKVCVVDKSWSGLKLMARRERRHKG